MAAAVYSAISRVSAELSKAGIAKTHVNAIDQYQYRSIDDVLNHLSPLLAKHRLCVLPRVLRRIETERVGLGEAVLLHVVLKVRFDLVSADDGSSHTIIGFGEALDASDKGTAKAMSSAYKAAMLETFCIPVSTDDPDSSSPKLKRGAAHSEPVHGWDSWVSDIIDMIGICESEQALRAIQTRHGALLSALSRARRDLYILVGDNYSARSASLAGNGKTQPSANKGRAKTDQRARQTTGSIRRRALNAVGGEKERSTEGAASSPANERVDV